jgi:hypothetical protein
MKIRIATFEELFNSLPEDQKTEDVIKDLKYWYEREVKILNECSKNAKEPSIGLFPFNKSGRQYIAEFWVNDLAKPKREEYNWHLQNTSQWLYAGCILVQDGRVSTHH